MRKTKEEVPVLFRENYPTTENLTKQSREDYLSASGSRLCFFGDFIIFGLDALKLFLVLHLDGVELLLKLGALDFFLKGVDSPRFVLTGDHHQRHVTSGISPPSM
jgi:hypothetical protein